LERCGLDSSGSGQGPVAGCCEHGNEPSGSIKRVKSLCFNWSSHHKGVLGEWRHSSTHSLTSALDGSEWSASCSGRFTPRERAPGTPYIGGWVGPRIVLDTVVRRKIPSLRRESKPRTPIVQPLAQRYTDWAITASNFLTDWARALLHGVSQVFVCVVDGCGTIQVPHPLAIHVTAPVNNKPRNWEMWMQNAASMRR
jgi:hypothetical protein